MKVRDFLLGLMMWSGVALGAGFVVPVQQETPQPQMKHRPYATSCSLPTPTAEESARGFFLYSRPLTSPIYQSSSIASQERITALRGFGARGQFVNLNVALLPFRELKKLEVVDSGGPGRRQLRRVVYWMVRFPHYTTQDGYRLNPEYLFPQEVPFTAPKGISQRFVLTIRLPEDAPAGDLKGHLTIRAEGLQEPVVVPYTVRVFPFALRRDPQKHFSAYSYAIFRSQRHEIAKNHQGDVAWQQRATVNQYRTMVDYGFTFPPFLYLEYDRKGEGRYYIRDYDEFLRPAMAEAGMKTPFMVVGQSGIGQLYHEFTGKHLGSHMRYDVEPPEAMYQKIERMVKEFMVHAKKKHYPRIIFAPIDEPSKPSMKMVRKVYQAFKKSGCELYVTSCPAEGDITDLIDYWSDQPFRSYQEVMAKDKKMYWCYPNHNSYEIKNMETMCRGGRMTYGFGMWKSGYNVMIPWIWQNSRAAHLRGRYSGGGNVLCDDATTQVGTYWECFREGIIDGQYIYTLSQAIVEREPATDPQLKALLAEGRILLQDIWNSIPVMKKYLDSGHFCDDEFDGRRAELALMIQRILAYPATNKKVAESVIIDPYAKVASVDIRDIFKREKSRGNLAYRAIPHASFEAHEDETTLEAPEPGVTRFHVLVDHKRDGAGGKGKYLLGWPRVRMHFRPEAVNLNDYDFLSFRMRVTSNRDGETAPNWPLRLDIHSSRDQGKRSVEVCDRVEPGEWKDYLFSLADFRKTMGHTLASFSAVDWMQFWIGETRYNHGDDLRFDFADVQLVGMKSPVLWKVEMPDTVSNLLGETHWKLFVMGEIPQGIGYDLQVLDAQGQVKLSQTSKSVQGEHSGTLSLKGLPSGSYTVEFRLKDASGKLFQGKPEQVLRTVIRLINL